MLAAFYENSSDEARNSISFVWNNVHGGWLLISVHTNCAFFLFFFLLAHMLKAFFYCNVSELISRKIIYMSEFLLFLTLMFTAFLGYTLPFGQMSYWGATIITNLLTIVPYGETLVRAVWGGLSVGSLTIKKFYLLHFIIPFFMLYLVVVHIFFIHNISSTSPSPLKKKINVLQQKFLFINLFPLYLLKDLVMATAAITLLVLVLFLDPDFFCNPVNNIPADPMVTPKHIVPEVYFLPFYAILKTIHNKAVRIIFMMLSIINVGAAFFSSTSKLKGKNIISIMIVIIILCDIGYNVPSYFTYNYGIYFVIMFFFVL